MRKTLANFRGKLVAWKGWETSQRHNRTWICISKAYVILWDKNIAVQKIVEKRGAVPPGIYKPTFSIAFFSCQHSTPFSVSIFLKTTF